MKISSQEASLVKEIVQKIHDQVILTPYGETSLIYWKTVSGGFIPSAVVRDTVISLLHEADMECVCIGDMLHVTNHNKSLTERQRQLAKEDKEKQLMFKIVRRIFDIIRYRASREKKGFIINWDEMLDDGSYVPKHLREILVQGFRSHGVPCEDKDALCIWADNSTLDNPFFQTPMYDVTPRKTTSKYLLTSSKTAD